MKHYLNKPALIILVILFTLSLVSCGGGGATGQLASGSLGLSLVDNPEDYDAVYVTINEIHVHNEETGWQVLPDEDLALPQTFNLIELVNGTMAYLGTADLPNGHYNQMRMILEDSEEEPDTEEINILGDPHPYYNYLIYKGDIIPLKVPSGGTSGIKLVKGFDIEFSGVTELVLDFDVDKSVVQAGNNRFWLLKPTIKVIDTELNSVSGTVKDEVTEGPVLEARVTAQSNYEEETLDDEADRVVVDSGSMTDIDGNYYMHISVQTPDDDPYNIVAARTGYAPQCKTLTSNETDTHLVDFDLAPLDPATEEGTFQVSVVGLAETDDHAVVSFRQELDGCGLVEIASVSIVYSEPDTEGKIYSQDIILPVGEYQVVAYASGQVTQDDPYEVTAGASAPLDIEFPQAP